MQFFFQIPDSSVKSIILTLIITLLFSFKILNAQVNQVSILIEDCILASIKHDKTLSDKILKFAKDSLGKKVGNGECTALIEKALTKNGGWVPPDDGTEDAYVWSSTVITQKDDFSVELIQPGDIIQFDSPNNYCGFEQEVKSVFLSTEKCDEQIIASGGKKKYPQFFVTENACPPIFHHTAIISRVVDINTGTLELLEQSRGVPVKYGYISLIDHYIYINEIMLKKFSTMKQIDTQKKWILKNKDEQVTEVIIDENRQVFDKNKINSECGIVYLSHNIGLGNFIIYRPVPK